MIIMRGNEVILIKEYGKMTTLGTVWEIGDITEKNVIIRNPNTKVAMIAVSIDDFYNYFRCVGNIKTWTEWTELVSPDGKSIGWYRTNRKKTQVKLHDGTRAEATCNKTDEFALHTGVNIALYRCYEKAKTKEFAKRMEEVLSLKRELNRMKENIGNFIAQVKPKSEV